MRRVAFDALHRRLQRGSCILAEQMLSHESQRRRAKSEQPVVEFADTGSPMLTGPIRAELLDHELAERIVQVSRIPGAALRLAFRGQTVEIGVLHEESGRILPSTSDRLLHDRRV